LLGPRAAALIDALPDLYARLDFHAAFRVGGRFRHRAEMLAAALRSPRRDNNIRPTVESDIREALQLAGAPLPS
jgi:hypothetical protein